MLQPSDVAVASDGRVAVADGIHDRVAVFWPDGRLGRFISLIGGGRLDSPLGLTIDAQDRLWIADTGNRRVVACTLEGELVRIVPIQTAADASEDLTDVVVSSDARSIFVVDNRLHRLARVELATGMATLLGGPGEGRGEFNYPYFIAAGRRDKLFVSDVINARIVVMDQDGVADPPLGAFGVGLGMLYRPKGVACDGQGRVWVADGRLGAVSAFGPEGRFLDVLRTADGRPMRFRQPSGLAVDARGLLYVVESATASVRKVEITEDASVAARSASPPEAKVRQPQTCTVCHLEWTAPLIDGQATELAEVPDNPKDHPLASHSETCQSCHDGSVADSRKRVWLQHGHGTGVRPPADMNVPVDLPLVDGQVVCRTCHSAHTRGGSGNTLKDAVFLRVRSHPAELCVRCHADFDDAGVEGMHPTDIGAAGLPEELIAAGSRRAAGIRGPQCLVCHTPHGAGEAALLVEMPSADRLCLNCHPQQAGPGIRAEHGHPMTGPLSDTQRDALSSAAVRAVWTQQLGCLSCHKVHHAASATSLLSAPTAESDLCMTCHADKHAVAGSPHDLRITAPLEANARGETADVSGPCAACHGVHASARTMEPVDAAGADACIDCHRPDGCAAANAGAPLAHPVILAPQRLAEFLTLTGAPTPAPGSEACLRCVHCHDPHEPARADFLRQPPDALCAGCHADKSGLVNGPHDFAGQREWLNGQERNAEQTGRCGFCHAVHGGTAPALWSATASAPQNAEALCTECHRSGGFGTAAEARRLVHPVAAGQPMRVDAPHGDRPLFDASGHRVSDGDLSCATCHDPHVAPATAAMLRLQPNENQADVCGDCHGEARTLPASAHAATVVPDSPAKTAACAPCHDVHAPADRPDATDTWTAPRAAGSAFDPSGKCLGCHGVEGIALSPDRLGHPQVWMTNLVGPDSRSFMPLLDASGSLAASGFVTCVTCHVPHGRFEPDEVAWALTADPTRKLLRATKPMLRAFAAPNLCTQCHGEEAMERFLFFHAPSRRWALDARPR